MGDMHWAGPLAISNALPLPSTALPLACTSAALPRFALPCPAPPCLQQDAGFLLRASLHYILLPIPATERFSGACCLQVAGLWFVLAGSIVIAFVLVLAFKLARRSAKKVAQTRRFQAGVSKLHRSVSRLGSGKLSTLVSFGRRGRGGDDDEEDGNSLPDDKGLSRSPPSEQADAHGGVDMQAVAAAAARQAVQEYHARMEQLLQTKV